MKKEKDRIDIGEFTKWLKNNIHRILNMRQTIMFTNMNMGIEDLKLFGKSNDPFDYYFLHKDEFEKGQFSSILEMGTNYYGVIN
jgi:hypothetical protein